MKNGVWEGVPKISKCIHNTEAQVTASPNVQLTKRTLWRRKGRKAKGIARETKGDIVAVPNLRARKGGRLLGQRPVTPEQWNSGSPLFGTAQRGRDQKLEADIGGQDSVDPGRNNVHVLEGWMESRLQSGWPRLDPNFTTEQLCTWIVYSNQTHLSIWKWEQGKELNRMHAQVGICTRDSWALIWTKSCPLTLLKTDVENWTQFCFKRQYLFTSCSPYRKAIHPAVAATGILSLLHWLLHCATQLALTAGAFVVYHFLACIYSPQPHHKPLK